MTEKKQIEQQPKSAKGDWWGGLFCFGLGVYILLSVVRGGTWIPYKRYGATDPLAPWQGGGIGVLFLIMGIWQFVIAIRTTKLKKKETATQNQSSEPT
jgi:hypothetical protein